MDDAIATAAAVRAGTVSPREVVAAAIDRIETTGRLLGAVVYERFEAALAEVDAGLPDGPLRGVPVLVKDLGCSVAGLPYSGGSRLFAGSVGRVDSVLVSRYRAAGMVVLGSTTTPELGRSTSTEPLLHGPARNPWDPAHSTGGSSGGSAAAVAGGLVPVAHATDGGGSIRIPAAMCGLVGLKPTRGLVPTWPEPTTLSSPLGVHHAVTRTVRDSALLLDLAARRMPGEPPIGPEGGHLAALATGPGRLRIAVTTTTQDGAPADPAVAAAVERTAAVLADLGHAVVEARPPWETAAVGAAMNTMFRVDLVGTVRRRLAELGRELLEDDLEPWTHLLHQRGSGLTAGDLEEALRTAERTAWAMGEFLTAHDVLLSPVIRPRVPLLGHLDPTDPASMGERFGDFWQFTGVFNVTGQPAVAVPAGQDPDGLPIGVQLGGDAGTERRLLAVAAQLEEAAPWPLTAPPERLRALG
ncbi:amidase [Blastococcus sp. SYSU D00820]